MSELKIGDVVQLKSGGPAMTINALGSREPLTAYCAWFDGTNEKTASFPVTSLQAYVAPAQAALSGR